jgi:hypothetical protein
MTTLADGVRYSVSKRKYFINSILKARDSNEHCPNLNLSGWSSKAVLGKKAVAGGIRLQWQVGCLIDSCIAHPFGFKHLHDYSPTAKLAVLRTLQRFGWRIFRAVGRERPT